MSVSTDYATPVQVNGYTCRNCTDVDNAKKHIDPEHPKSGPYGVNAQDDPPRDSLIKFGGALSGLNRATAAPSDAPPPQGATGAQIDVKV